MFNDTILGVIYMIRHITDDTKKVYIGSTNNLERRINQHKSTYKDEKYKLYNNKLYTYIRENGGFDEYYFEILECYVCNYKYELLNMEDDYILAYGDMCLNMMRAYLTDEEKKERDNNHHKLYFKNNRELLLQKMKEYRKKNIEKIREYQKNRDLTKKRELEKTKVICPICGLEITRYKLKRHQESNNCKNDAPYNEKREEMLKKQREKKKEQYTCECGVSYTKNHKARHEKSIKHQEFIKNKNNVST